MTRGITNRTAIIIPAIAPPDKDEREVCEATFGVAEGIPFVVGDNAVAKLPDEDRPVGRSPLEIPGGKFGLEVSVGCEACGSLPGLTTGPGVGFTVGVTTGDAGTSVSSGASPSEGAATGEGAGAACDGGLWGSLSSELTVLAASGSVGFAESLTMDIVATGSPPFAGGLLSEGATGGSLSVGVAGGSSPEMAEAEDGSEN